MFNGTMYKAKIYGKDKWTYGFLVMVDYRYAIIRDTLRWSDDGSYFLADVGSWDFVEKNTIRIGSQLFDNDNTQIYDGDIIESGNDRYVVVFEDDVFWAFGRVDGEAKKILLSVLIHESPDGVKVIGNRNDDFYMYLKIVLN